MTACRECHREDEHTLSCSHVRYDGRIAVVPEDDVAPPHEPFQPYCPGPAVACYYSSIGEPDGYCHMTGRECYYGAEVPDGA